MPALPSSVLEPLWVQIAELLPPARSTTHSAATDGASPDRIIFDKLIQVLVFGCGYRRIADATCSATPALIHSSRRRRSVVAEQVRLAVLSTSTTAALFWDSLPASVFAEA